MKLKQPEITLWDEVEFSEEGCHPDRFSSEFPSGTAAREPAIAAIHFGPRLSFPPRQGRSMREGYPWVAPGLQYKPSYRRPARSLIVAVASNLGSGGIPTS